MQIFNKHEGQLLGGLTGDLWKNFPAAEILAFRDYNVGYGVMLNPAAPPYCPVNNTTAIGGSDGAVMYTDSAEYIRGLLTSEHKSGGVRAFATTDNQEAWCQWCGGGDPFIISDTAADARELVFEAAFRIVNITTAKYGFFIGLMEAGCAAADTIADAGTLADKDMIGIFKPEGNTSGLDLVYRINGESVVEHAGDWQTLATNTWYHFGLRYNPINKVLTPWWGVGTRATRMAPDKDNAILPTDIGAATFPDGEGLAPIFGLKNAHADDAWVDLRIMACAQRAAAVA